MLEIKPAQSEDAVLLSKFAERTFRETFERDNSAENMALYISETFSPDKQLAEILDPNRRIVFATSGNELIGFYHLLVGKPDDAIRGPHPIELLRLYIDSQFHGKGLAHRLLGEAIDRSKQERFETIWLGVWEKNYRAQAFYKKWGFEEVGSHIFRVGTDPQRDLVYSKALLGD